MGAFGLLKSVLPASGHRDVRKQQKNARSAAPTAAALPRKDSKGRKLIKAFSKLFVSGRARSCNLSKQLSDDPALSIASLERPSLGLGHSGWEWQGLLSRDSLKRTRRISTSASRNPTTSVDRNKAKENTATTREFAAELLKRQEGVGIIFLSLAVLGVQLATEVTGTAVLAVSQRQSRPVKVYQIWNIPDVKELLTFGIASLREYADRQLPLTQEALQTNMNMASDALALKAMQDRALARQVWGSFQEWSLDAEQNLQDAIMRVLQPRPTVTPTPTPLTATSSTSPPTKSVPSTSAFPPSNGRLYPVKPDLSAPAVATNGTAILPEGTAEVLVSSSRQSVFSGFATAQQRLSKLGTVVRGDSTYNGGAAQEAAEEAARDAAAASAAIATPAIAPEGAFGDARTGASWVSAATGDAGSPATSSQHDLVSNARSTVGKAAGSENGAAVTKAADAAGSLFAGFTTAQQRLSKLGTTRKVDAAADLAGGSALLEAQEAAAEAAAQASTAGAAAASENVAALTTAAGGDGFSGLWRSTSSRKSSVGSVVRDGVWRSQSGNVAQLAAGFEEDSGGVREGSTGWARHQLTNGFTAAQQRLMRLGTTRKAGDQDTTRDVNVGVSSVEVALSEASTKSEKLEPMIQWAGQPADGDSVVRAHFAIQDKGISAITTQGSSSKAAAGASSESKLSDLVQRSAGSGASWAPKANGSPRPSVVAISSSNGSTPQPDAPATSSASGGTVGGTATSTTDSASLSNGSSAAMANGAAAADKLQDGISVPMKVAAVAGVVATPFAIAAARGGGGGSGGSAGFGHGGGGGGRGSNGPSGKGNGEGSNFGNARALKLLRTLLLAALLILLVERCFSSALVRQVAAVAAAQVTVLVVGAAALMPGHNAAGMQRRNDRSHQPAV